MSWDVDEAEMRTAVREGDADWIWSAYLALLEERDRWRERATWPVAVALFLRWLLQKDDDT